ncbi:Transcriptional activator spt7 [Fusarium oxysporum]|nr:Transcriptional activator spt7 [Fusarium oxysporum]
MSITNGQPAWQPPYLHHTNSNRSVSHLDDVPARTQTPIDNPSVLMPEAPLDIEEENRRALFADLYRKTEDKVALLFSEDGSYNYPAISALRRSPPPPQTLSLPRPTTSQSRNPP